MPVRIIQVGTGGIGKFWCERFLPPFIASGHAVVVAAVDVNPDALANAQSGLGLTRQQCYTSLAEALANHAADVCTVVVPPSFHEEVITAALRAGLDILSEKPIADSLDASLRIANSVRQHGKRMAITFSHRFDQDKTTFRNEVWSPRNGRLDYVVGRFTSSNRRMNSWGEFRHRMADPLMIEGAIHHLDFIVDLMRDKCAAVSARTWNPAWGEYAGDSEGLVLLDFARGGHALYEGSTSTAVGLNSWGSEYFRAECEDATIVLNRRRVVRYAKDAGKNADGYPQGDVIALADGNCWTHYRLISDFLSWLSGGPEPPTSIDACANSSAVMFAAIESSRSGQSVRIDEMVAAAMRP